MIETGIFALRDPFVLVDGGAYYVYGTDVSAGDWQNCTWECYKTEDLKSGRWEKLDKIIYEIPSTAEKQFWAPEVHKYRGCYYMLASYYSSKTKHRGCSVLKSFSPEGPFVEITDGHVTPPDWDAIDGTLYVDADGTPWMVFVHEWTSTDDKVGRMAAARLSDDLSRFVSEPKELFRANDPSWTSGGTTDGPFIYKTMDGQLLMLWSNFVGKDYCVGIARSRDGRVDGEWTHDDTLLFSKKTSGGADGGHGMIFCDKDGSMYLSVHSPNVPRGDEREQVVFITIREENGTLI